MTTDRQRAATVATNRVSVERKRLYRAHATLVQLRAAETLRQVLGDVERNSDPSVNTYERERLRVEAREIERAAAELRGWCERHERD
jgi:hypothetical protein